MPAVAHERQARGVDRLHRPDRVAFDARDLHQAADRVAGEAQVVFHADFGGVLDLFGGAAHDGAEAGGGHRAGHADFALAADLGARDGGVLLVEHTDGARGQQEVLHVPIGAVRVVPHGVVQHRGHDARRTVGGGRDHASAAGVFFVDGQRVEGHPVELLQGV